MQGGGMAPYREESEVGDRIFSSRQRRGLSQGTVSRLAGIHPSYLSRIETGKVHPTVRTAVRIATALQISLDELLGPSPASSADKPCPISPNGRCFIELIEKATGRKATLELAPMQPGDVRETFADIEASRRDLGFAPSTSIEEGIPRFVAWFREYHGV